MHRCKRTTEKHGLNELVEMKSYRVVLKQLFFYVFHAFRVAEESEAILTRPKADVLETTFSTELSTGLLDYLQATQPVVFSICSNVYNILSTCGQHTSAPSL